MIGMNYDSGESHDYGTDVPSTTTFNNKSTFNYYPLTIETPTEDQHAATKKYVDDSVSSISTDSLIDGENILILNGGSATE